MVPPVLRFKCGRSSVAFAIASGEVICAITDGGAVFRESWCRIERPQMARLIEGLADLLRRSDAEARGGYQR